jgi:hypothetical protein
MTGYKTACKWALVLASASIVLAPAAATAASTERAEAQARFQVERSACLSGSTNQSRATCLQEASAALAQARLGQLDTSDDTTYTRNKINRCEALPQDDREDCLRRMRGEGSTSGSVEAGGIYRELTRTIPPR